jgi:NifU-like protein involved in Fe-S cluster formation
MDYSSEVLQRFDPPAAGDGPDAALAVAAEAEDRTLNVWIRCFVEVRETLIRDVRFRVFGCPHTIAAARRAEEQLRDRPIAALRGVDFARIASELSVPTEKLGKLLRIEDALLACSERIEAAAQERRKG